MIPKAITVMALPFALVAFIPAMAGLLILQHRQSDAVCKINRQITSRQMFVLDQSVGAANVFASYSPSPKVREFFRSQIPVREAQLANATKALRNFDCGDE